MNLKQSSDGKNFLPLLIWPKWKPLLIVTNFLSQQVPLMSVTNHTDLQLITIFVNQRKTLWVLKIIKDYYPKTEKKREKKPQQTKNPTL